MKILTLSLLRLGDLLLMTPALRGLKQKFPQCELHVMINNSVTHVSSLLTYVDNFIVFKRDSLQQALGAVESSIFAPYDELNDWLNEINTNNYDLIINLTHTVLSGYIMGLLQGKRKVGLTLAPNQGPTFNSPWFEYLNNDSAKHDPPLYHFADVYYYGCELDKRVHPISLTGLSGIGYNQKKLVVQPFTSTRDKDYPVADLVTVLDAFHSKVNYFTLTVLGAPYEAEKMNLFTKALAEAKIPYELCLCDLLTALQTIQSSHLLLTGDTSIKHLAAATNVKIVELAIGPSNIFETGAYGNDHVIIRSSQWLKMVDQSGYSKKYFSNNIPSQLVSNVLIALADAQTMTLTNIAREYAKEAEIFLTHIDENCLWRAKNLVSTTANPRLEYGFGVNYDSGPNAHLDFS